MPSNPPGFLTFEEFSKPSQAKWFKNAKGNMPGASMTNSPDLMYQQWLQMLQQRAAALPTPTTGGGVRAPRPGGGGGSRATGGGLQPGAAGPAGAGTKPWQNPARPNGAPPSYSPGPKPQGQAPAPGQGLVPNQGAAPPPAAPSPDWGKNGGPGAEQQANPMDIISRLLRQYQGGQRGQSMMGGKG
jgi:hypothetical protein